MTVTSILIGLFMVLWLPLIAQAKESDGSVSTDHSSERAEEDFIIMAEQNLPGPFSSKDSTLLSRLSDTRIIFKDGSIRKNCVVRQINDYWIVYEKDGSLHDLMIDQIRKIEVADGSMQAVYFDENNKPVLRVE